MATDGFDFDALAARFGELGHRDRKAVLARLGPQERAQVEAAMAAQAEARRREADRIHRAGRQFAGYSPWLSSIVEAACAGDGEGEGVATLRPAAARALAEVHRAMHGEEDARPTGWPARLRRWKAALSAPEEGRRV